MTAPAVRTIATTTHGRYLMAAPGGTPAGVIVGFHGYAENAEVHLEALRAIPGTERWLLVAVQALHPFYTRDDRVVANWMTRQDRELAVADNIAFVARVVEAVRDEHPVRRPLVFVGFSQGGAMAYRAAAHTRADGLMILAADVPPDVSEQAGLTLPPVLIGRGTQDRWYTADQHAADRAVLERVGISVESCVFDGAHEWGSDFREAAARYLAGLI
jgi:predicted esterase